MAAISHHTDTASDEQKRAALGVITEAWIEAVQDGLDPGHVADAAFEMSVRELVALRGEKAVAELLGETTARVERGEFCLHLTRQ